MVPKHLQTLQKLISSCRNKLRTHNNGLKQWFEIMEKVVGEGGKMHSPSHGFSRLLLAIA